MRKLVVLALFLALGAPAQAKCLKLTDPKVEIEIDVLAKKSGQSKAQIFSILDTFECSHVPRSEAFDSVWKTIGNMQDMRNNAPGATAMREQMMAGLRGRDRAAMEDTFDDLHRLANDNNLAGFLNRVKEKGEDVYRAHLERNDPSAPQFIASEREQAKACTPERIAASAERAKDCAPEQSAPTPAPEQSTAAPVPEQSTAAPAPEQSAAAPAPEQPRGWIAEVKESRPICASAADYVQFHRTSFDIARRPSRKAGAAMQKAIEFVKRKCPIAMFEPGDHAKVERTETFPINKTKSITLACVVIKDGPCAWTDASHLVRIPEEMTAKKSTQSDTKSVQDAEAKQAAAAAETKRQEAERRKPVNRVREAYALYRLVRHCNETRRGYVIQYVNEYELKRATASIQAMVKRAKNDEPNINTDNLWNESAALANNRPIGHQPCQHYLDQLLEISPVYNDEKPPE